jgi:hypothetical protein
MGDEGYVAALIGPGTPVVDALAHRLIPVTGPPIIGWLVSRTGGWPPAWWMSCAGRSAQPAVERAPPGDRVRTQCSAREDADCEPESAVLPARSLGRCDRLPRLGSLRRNSGRTCSATYAKAFPAGCFSPWFPAVAKGSRSSGHECPRLRAGKNRLHLDLRTVDLAGEVDERDSRRHHAVPPAPVALSRHRAGTADPRQRNWRYRPVPRDVGYARLSSSTGMVRTPAVCRAYSAKPG